MTILNVQNLHVCYDDASVIHDVSLSVQCGEIVTVLGANGAGKSTLLRSISGLIRPSQGSITFNGQRIDGLPPFRITEMGIAQVPEGRHIFSNMTVKENLLIGAYIHSVWRERHKRLSEVINLFPILKKRGQQLAGTLSGGEQQILAIGRALMGEPILIMLDEPSLGLAPNWVSILLGRIQELRAIKGIGVLLVEQNATLALQLADRGYVLESGHITFQGSRDEIVNNSVLRSAYLGL